MGGKLYKLDGTVINPDGSTNQSNIFDFLDLGPDDYSDITFTAEEATQIQNRLRWLSTGASAAAPLICGGRARCPFKTNCPLVQMDDKRRETDPDAPSKIPVGRPCIVEVNLLREWTRQYLEQFEVEPDNRVDISHCQELAEVELYLWRLNQNLSKPEHAELVQEVTMGLDRDGNAVTRLESNAFYETREKLLARKTKLMKLMVGDRESKLKEKIGLKIKEGGSMSAEASKLQQLLNTAKSNAEARQKQLTPNNLLSEVVEGDGQD